MSPLPHFVSRITLAACAAVLAACASVTDPAPTPRYAEINGVRLAYVEQGQGTPVVFVHGSISDWRTWEAQRVAFSAKHRYIAYSQRYFGTDPWHLVGWSYSGEVIALVALEHPELVRSVAIHEGGFRSLTASSPEGKQALADYGKAFGPAIAAAKTGDLPSAAKLFLEVVFELAPGGFDSDPSVPRKVIPDNARTIPLGLAAPPAPRVRTLRGCAMDTSRDDDAIAIAGFVVDPLQRELRNACSARHVFVGHILNAAGRGRQTQGPHRQCGPAAAD